MTKRFKWSDDEPLAEMYAQLPDFGESDLVHLNATAGAHILELGCGTGRMTRRLLELGHPVSAVDASDKMLSHVPEEATKIQADIERLDLSSRFPVVLLASNLINTPDKDSRARLLASCRRHVGNKGIVIIQRFAPGFTGWDNRSWRSHGDVESRIARADRHGDKFSAAIEYRDRRGGAWRQDFTAQLLDDAALALEGREAGLELVDPALASDASWVKLAVSSQASH